MNSFSAILGQSMNLSRSSVAYLANDLANLNTPDFKAQSLDWQSALHQAIANNQPVTQTHGTVQTEAGSMQPDSSSVNMTNTMSSLTEGQMVYSTAATAWSNYQNTMQDIANLTV